MGVRMEEGRLTSEDGITLYYRRWIPPQTTSGEMVLVHGAFEHSGKYMHVGEWFAEQGFDVRAMDHRGFGQSEGYRCYVERFDDYLHDLHLFVTMTGEQPVLLGHSMGGLVAFQYAQVHPETIRALVLSSPWFEQRVKVNPLLKALAPVVARLAPRLHLPIPLPPATASGTTGQTEDPLVWNRPTPRWYQEMERAAASCFHCDRLEVPALFLQAGADQLVSPAATRLVFDGLEAPKRAFKVYAGKQHEIFNDPGYEEVFRDILSWLQPAQSVGT